MISFKTAIPLLALLLAGSCSPKMSTDMQAANNVQQDQASSSSRQTSARDRHETVNAGGPTGETLQMTTPSKIAR